MSAQGSGLTCTAKFKTDRMSRVRRRNKAVLLWNEGAYDMYHVCLHTRLDGMYLCSRATLFVPYLISKKSLACLYASFIMFKPYLLNFSRVIPIALTMNSRSYGLNVIHKLFFHLTWFRTSIMILRLQAQNINDTIKIHASVSRYL